MDNKSKYRELCETETTIPIYSRDWWMDAVCGEDNWDVLLVEKNGQILGAMPYFIKKKYGLKYITQPKLTKTNGLWIKYHNNKIQKNQNKISHENKIMFDIMNQLELLNIDYYQQNFHYSFTNWLPFHWKNFKQTTNYVYVIEDLNDLDKIHEQFSSDIRRQIKKAKKIVEIKEDCDIEEFYIINSKTYERQGLKMSISLEFLKRLDKACIEKKCRKILYAVDENKNIHAATYFVWDENSSYGLLSGADPELRNSQAGTLLMWEAIKYTSTVTKKFDFQGSMIEPIEKFLREFGGVQKPYFSISKNMKKKLLFDIRNCIKSLFKR